MLLEVRSLTCRIKQKYLFSRLSFNLKEQGLVCIEGGSGRGKSSLLFGIRGIGQKGKHYTGAISFRGRPLDETARHQIGLVLQNPHSQMISTLVREELMFAYTEKNNDETKIRFNRTVEILGLAPLLDKPVRTLSSGQKHLVSIAAAGIMTHEVLLMDEPFLYLDPSNITRVLKYITYLRDKGTGIVITSHPGILDAADAGRIITLENTEKSDGPTPCFADLKKPKAGLEKRLITLDRVGYGYNGQPLLARKLSFSIHGGQELWIEGINGSGKTTLLNIMSGTGHVELGNVIRTGRHGSCRVVTITQNPDRHFFESSVRKEMEAVLKGKQTDRRLTPKDNREIQELLSGVGLTGKDSLSPFKLSFGEKIHLASAQAVLLRPDFIFIDDILGFLDAKERINLLAFLQSARRNNGCGLVFTSSRGRFHTPGESTLVKLSDYSPDTATTVNSFNKDVNPPAQKASYSPPKKNPGIFKRFLSAFKSPAFDYVAGDSFLHTTSPLVKMLISMGAWFLIYKSGTAYYLHMGAVLILYYLGTGIGMGRFLADSRFFILQMLIFTAFMPLFRWDISAAGEGALAGIRVWLFFLPVIVMMRTTTVEEWMNMFSRFLSKRQRLAVGIAFGLLPCITADAGEILRIQAQKGLAPCKKDIFHPRRLFTGLKAIFIPMIILMEDIAHLAGLSVKLKGFEE